jgi:hypothetical protein
MKFWCRKMLILTEGIEYSNTGSSRHFHRLEVGGFQASSCIEQLRKPESRSLDSLKRLFVWEVQIRSGGSASWNESAVDWCRFYEK